jgi:DNA-binding IclR family transcriptional regulator
VSRVTSILEAAAAAPNGVNLASLAVLLEAPKSSVHGLLQGLVATGYLQESPGGYTLGPAVAMLTSADNPSVLISARRSLEIIERACHESATLCTLVGDSVVYVDKVESSQLIRYSAPLRVRRPIYPTSAGKCFLAHLPEARKTRILRQLFTDPEDIARVRAELDDVVANGYSVNRGETVPDVYAVASPVLLAGRPVACLQAAGPASRVADHIADIAEVVKAEAVRLSRSKG